MKMLLRTLILAAGLMVGFSFAPAAAQPCQWNYSFVNGVATASYCGNVQANGTITNNYIITPQQYGALGDGIHNDTAAIQEAIDSGYGFIHFPATSACYLIDPNIILRSNQTWYGDGENSSVLCWAQNNIANPIGDNGLIQSGDLSNWRMAYMGLKGNLAAQTSADVGSQDLEAIRLTGGSVQNITLDHVHIWNWGTQHGSGYGTDSGGACGFINPQTGSNTRVENILITYVTCEDIRFNPGFDIALSNGGTAIAGSNITISHSHFIQSSSYAAPVAANFIFIHGCGVADTGAGCTSDIPMYNCNVNDNTADVSNGGLDTFVEFDYCVNGSMTGNHMTLFNTAKADGLLLRPSANINISNNVLTNLGTGATTSTGIALFDWNPATDSNTGIVGSANSIINFGSRGLSISEGTKSASFTDTYIDGLTNVTQNPIYITDAQNVFLGNTIVHHGGVSILGSSTVPLRSIVIDGGSLSDVGASGNYIFSTPGANQDVEELTIQNMTVQFPVTGTIGFISPSFLSANDNQILNNSIGSLININPSFSAYISNYNHAPVSVSAAYNSTIAPNSVDLLLSVTNVAAKSGDTCTGSLESYSSAVILSCSVEPSNSVRVYGYNSSASPVSLNTTVRATVQ